MGQYARLGEPKTMEHTANKAGTDSRGERGAALLLALALLGLMTIMGTYYVRFMSLEVRTTQYDEAQTRARLAAESGIEAALAALTRAHDEGQTHFSTAQPHTYTLPVYRYVAGGSGRGFDVDENREAQAVVTVQDENSKINLNTAPAPVIAEVLGVEPETAEAIVASQPRQTGVHTASLRPTNAEGEELQWLYTLDDLKARGLVTPEQFAAIDRSLVTTFSALPFTDTAEQVNINTSPPAVLAAAIGVPLEQGEKIAERRPFQSLPAFLGASGKLRAEDFALGATGDKRSAFTTQSRVFRLVSEGHYIHHGLGNTALQEARAYVEAIVRFNDDGAAATLYWNTSRTRNLQEDGAA